MPEHRHPEHRMVAMQLTTDEGSFICNVDEADMAKIAMRASGTFITISCVIRLDAMFEGLYLINRTKMIEASSIDHHQKFRKSGKRVTTEA